ncbi:HU family DNA-binding protein [Parabacteroides timonensis]|uniref:HU family DNA-binding protein n=1 Tax=Parabacteroides timonensis TaxID=1871013 RepID=UPI00094EAA6D|nr:hypothetical protein [Parabacteroides timonensis]
MSIRYKFTPICDNLNKEGEKVKGYYPQVISRGTIHKEKFFDYISHGSIPLRAQLSYSWTLIEDSIIDLLEQGFDVCLNDFGTFSVSAESDPTEKKNEIRAESITVKGLNFRASKVINKKLKGIKFERDPEK